MDKIEAYVKEIEAATLKETIISKYDIGEISKFGIEVGKKYARITRTSYGQKSVHCFVEILTGDIYKAASWKVPAKGVRGNINSEKKPLLGYDYYR